MKTMHHAEIQDQKRIMNDHIISFHRSIDDSQEKTTQLQREMDPQRHAYSLQENNALTLFRAKLFGAESAASIHGAAARLSKAETEAHASVLSSEYQEGIGNMRILHTYEYLEVRTALERANM